jgi:hypothetical protein
MVDCKGRAYVHCLSIKNTANKTKMSKANLKNFLRDNAFYSVDEFINFRE